MKWRKWKSGYHGVRIDPLLVDVMGRIEEFVDYFRNRWREIPSVASFEKSYIFHHFSSESSLDWIFDERYLEDKKQDMMKEK